MSEHVKSYSSFSETRRVFKEYVHTWKVTDFSTLHPGVGNYIEGRGKLNGQDVWELKFYPDGYISENDALQQYNSTLENHIAIDVTFVKRFVDIKDDVYAYLLLIFLVDKNEMEHEWAKEQNLSRDNVFLRPLMTRQEICNEKDGFLQNGDLIIRFKIYFNETIDVIPKTIQSTSSNESNETFEMINEENLNGDVKIVVGDKEFWAYKNTLAKQSPVFAAMFKRKSKYNEIEIEDIDHETVREMLRFISDGKVRNMNNIASELFIAANKYELEKLKKICEETIIKTLKLENMISLLIFAEKYGADELKEKALDFFQLHVKEIDSVGKYKAEINSLMPVLPKKIKRLMK